VRRGSIVQLLLFALVAGGVATALAVVPGWLPHPASREAGRIDFVFWFVTVICVAIFAIVAAVIVYSLLKFRVHPDDDSDGEPIHGHTGLEITWTAIPTVLVIAIAVVSAIVLAKNGHAGANSLRVNVTGQQFAWSFSYPSQGGITSGTLRLPVDRSVNLYLRSRDTDVIHSFWVPEFSQKQDLLPGMTTHVVITPDRVGSYPVICTELCGLGHSVMRTTAIVMPPQAFAAWARKQRKAVAAGGKQAGKAVFASNGCGSCHTFAPAGSTGKIGPDLDRLPAEAKGAGKPLADFVHESIVDPNAYVAPGYPKNVMPSTFAQLPKSQLDALVQYLLQVKKGGK
jgi:cytochrome c oxidase subunit 2